MLLRRSTEVKSAGFFLRYANRQCARWRVHVNLRSAWDVPYGRKDFQFLGINSALRLAGWVLTRPRTSRRWAKGSTRQSLQLAMRLCTCPANPIFSPAWGER
jgi:hypothetical protein